MVKKYLSLMLVLLLFHTMISITPVLANSKEGKQAKLIKKLKADIARLGVGEDANIKVKLRDKTKLTGYISEAGEDSFVITDPKTGQASTVAYSNVVQAKGHSLSRRGLFILTVAVVVGLFLVAIFTAKSLDN